ncbi:N-6 DNA methylase [Clostridium sp.]|uniref:Eco57I restriction-modification methylase domain-containing protein n=1 Tax=Clostridium sp. TaxID=1506 RepID=UPI002FC6F5AE
MGQIFTDSIKEVIEIINSPIDFMFKETAINSFRRKIHIPEEKTIAEYYYETVKNNKERGIVYTPIPMAKYLIENTIKEDDVIKNPFIKIVDPACGTGNLLIECFNHLKCIYEKNLNELNKHKGLKLKVNAINSHIIKHNLYGFDTDEIALDILRLDLFSISGEAIENLYNEDYLLSERAAKYDIVIGNPPYIGPKSIDKEYSIRLKTLYKEVYKDKSDISYCFFKRSIDMLQEAGKITFITSRYFLESSSGKDLRGIIREFMSISKLIDFYGVRPFKGIGIDPVMIFMEKGKKESREIEVIKPLSDKGKKDGNFYRSLFLNEGNEYKRFFISESSLKGESWIIRDNTVKDIISRIEEKCEYLLSDICTSHQGIITGCDRAFVVKMETSEKENLENDILKPWIKGSYIRKNEVNRQNSYIIYSDLIKKEDEYPNSIRYISEYKDKLSMRRECARDIRQWYQLQWGRTQNIFEEKKIIFPFKAGSNKFALDEGSYFSADVYALRLKEQEKFTYEFLLFILNSNLYEFYFKAFAKKLGEDLYEYYPNNLMKLRIPDLKAFNTLTEDELYSYFNITEEEVEVIKSYL